MRIKNLVIIIFSLLSVLNTVDAQEATLDSLENVLKNEKNELVQIDLLNQLFKISSSVNYDKALQYSLLALKISKKQSHTSEVVIRKLSRSSNNVGIAYIQLAKYDLSLEHLLYSLEMAEEINDTLLMSNTINNLGALYGYKGDMEKAYDYFLRSAELCELSGDLESASGSYTNLAAIFFNDIEHHDKAIESYNKAMDISKKINNTNQIATLYSARAMGFRIEKKYKESLKYYQLAISIRVDEDDLSRLVSLYINMSSLYLHVNKRKEAGEYANLAIDIALELNSPDDIMRSYECLSDVQEKSGNMGKALENYKKSIEWKDTIYTQASQNAMAEMTAKYNFEKKEKENEILKQDAAINELEIENQQKEVESSKIIMYSAVGGGVLFLLLAFTLYNRNKIKQKANDELLVANNSLTEAKDIIEEKNRDITSSIEYAQYIQQAILPKKEIVDECFDDSLLMLLPKDLVSGDFYWFQKFGKYSVLVMADCTGHGVPGGFMSMMGAEMLNQVLSDPEILDAGRALQEIDERIKNNLNQVGSKRQQNDGMDMALCIFNMEDNTLQFSGANRPLILVRDGELAIIKPNKYGVGGLLDFKKEFVTENLKIQKGDCYYMYSDGYPDQFGGPKNKKFMRKKLNNLLLEHSSSNMDQQEKAFLTAFNEWKGNVEQIDDVCLIGIRV